MIFPRGTIRVVSPLTEDGSRLKIENDQVVYREDFFPLTAKKAFEDQNKILPKHLQKKIEVLTGHAEAPTIAAEQKRAKPGPKPKENAQSN